jgi:heavy metal sensor kinase
LFRIKIALLSVVISGAVLIIFGLFFLTVINRVGMERIDREILALGESQLHVWHPRKHWQDFDQSLRSIYGQSGWKNLIVQVTGADHRLLYRSAHWPQEINTALFPEFDVEMAKNRDPAGHGPLIRPSDGAGHIERDRIGPAPAARRRHQMNRSPLSENNEQVRPPPQHPRPAAPVQIKKPFFRTAETAAGTWRTGIMGNQHITIVLGMDLTGFHEDAKRYQKIFLYAAPLALLLLAGGGWLIAHRALKPITLITRTTERITARGLDQRIPRISADTELLNLVKVINKMLDRLEKSFEQAVRFSADAAHELQTPLTILQGHLDDALQHTPSGSKEQQRCSSLLEEVQRLKSIVRKLLILARADAGQLNLRLKSVDLSAMILSAVEDAGAMGPHLRIKQDIAPGITVKADPDLLKLVIQNLANNAVKYNRDDGMIRFRLTVQNKHARFTVTNTGFPIPDQARELIFDRFYRLDKSRSHRTPGTGLGLSLAREIVRAHGGDLHLHGADEDVNTFTLSIPCYR